MNYLKIFNRIALIACNTVAVIFIIWFIAPNISEAQFFEPAVNYAAGDWPDFVAIGDLDGDANPDLAVANYYSSNVSVLLGNGDGTFQIAVNYGTDNGLRSVAIGDLNDNGDPDLAVGTIGGSNVSVLLGNGDGTFQIPVNYAAGEDPRSVAIGDLNGDGPG